MSYTDGQQWLHLHTVQLSDLQHLICFSSLDYRKTKQMNGQQLWEKTILATQSTVKQ